jgi:hypothetical protein
MLHRTKDGLCGGVAMKWFVVLQIEVSASNLGQKIDNSGRYSHNRPQNLLNITSKYGSTAFRTNIYKFTFRNRCLLVPVMMLQTANSIVTGFVGEWKFSTQ